MTRDETIQVLTEISATLKSWSGFSEYPQAIDMAIEALSEPRGDLISREAAIDAVRERKFCAIKGSLQTEPWYEAINEVLEILSALPSAEAETVDCTELIRWLTETVMDDGMWELNAVAYGEVIARKLTKLGVLEVKDDVYVYEPSAEPKTDEENELKFYYVESIDDYWVGRRLDNFYYANWHKGLGFVWSHSRYLPWGEHIVDENTLWKEHTYPSEPIEIPFTEWVVGFVKKYFTEPKTGEWINHIAKEIHTNAIEHGWWEEELSLGEIVALCHSELSEALEAYRNGEPMMWMNEDKPDGIAIEMIDCMIRILDYLAKENIDIDRLLMMKHEYNKTRTYKHGNKKL